MSDLPLDDELLSAYIDDEVDAADRARIEADANAMSRVAELRSAGRAIAADVPPVAPEVREAQIARAIDVFAPGAPATDTTVASFGRARAEKKRRSVDWQRFAVAAAVIAAVLIAVPLLARLGGGDSDSGGGDTATGVATATTAAGDAGAARAEAPAELDEAESFAAADASAPATTELLERTAGQDAGLVSPLEDPDVQRCLDQLYAAEPELEGADGFVEIADSDQNQLTFRFSDARERTVERATCAVIPPTSTTTAP